MASATFAHFRKTGALFLLLLLAACTPPAFAEPHEIDLAPYANGSIEKNLFPTFPTGHVVPPMNSFGVPFNIPAQGYNFIILDSDSGKSPLTIPIGIPGVKKVYTLMQSYAPWTGYTICTVDFIGKEGARQSFALKGGVDLRDFFESGFARVINNSTSRPAFECIGRGGATTSNTSTGPRGFYNFDEQEFTLDPVFADQTLESITFTAGTRGGTPILLGLTTETSANPPASPVTVFPTAESHVTSSTPVPKKPTETPPSTPDEPSPPSYAGFWLGLGAGLLIAGAVFALMAIRRWLNTP